MEDENQQNINYQNNNLTKLRMESAEEYEKYRNMIN